MNIKSKLLLTPENFKPSFKNWKIEGVLNPSAIRLPSKRIILYARIAESSPNHQTKITCPIMSSENEYKLEKIHMNKIVKKGKWGEIYLKDGSCRLPTISHFRRIILNENGFDVEKIEQDPIFTGRTGDGEYGVEDPRIVKIQNDYFMTYVNVSKNDGVCTSLAVSKDLEKWNRKGIIFPEQNKDAVLFPEKINGYYVALHRPEGTFEFSKPSIWISYSKDLIYWGRAKSIMHPHPFSWESSRIGTGAPPIKTDRGWLCIYHGVEIVKDEVEGKDHSVYSAAAVLLDLKNPEKTIARSYRKKPLFKPSQSYETHGFMNNVVFPTGAVKTLNEKSLLIYCGAADSNIVVKEISIKEILDSMEWR